MDDLFRFVALRAPDPADPTQAIVLANRNDFQKALSAIHTPTQDQTPPSPAAPTHLKLDPLVTAIRIVEEYMTGSFGTDFIRDPSTMPLAKNFDDLYIAISNGSHSLKLNGLKTLVQEAFHKDATAVVADAEFRKEKLDVSDSIIAIFIDPVVQGDLISKLTRIARLINLIEHIAIQDKSLNDARAVDALLSATLLLPPTIFPIRPDLPRPVGIGDLLVVKQNIKRYELGEIANIENILRGETRNKTTKHNLTLDRTLVTETEQTTETTQELTTTERFELKTEAENTVKEDISAHGGMSVSATYGSVQINANADAAYGLSKSQSTKASTDHAKDVTSRAASKVTETVRQQVTSRTIEIFEEDEEHGFDNKNGQKNISGLYQWINKVYEAQVYNYGSRLLFDLMIPEPASFLLDAVAEKDQNDSIKPPEPFVLILNDPFNPNSWRPVKADDLGPDGLLAPDKVKLSRPVTPGDLTLSVAEDNYYGLYVAKYGAAGVKAPPEPTMTVSKGLTGNKDDSDHLAVADNLPIPTGYKADSTAVRGAFTLYEHEDGDEAIWVFVGKQMFTARGNGNLKPHAPIINPGDLAPDELGNIPIAIETQQARDFAITVDVTCLRTEAALEQWRIDTHNAIMNAYMALLANYQDARASQTFQNAGQAPLGGNPDQNRSIEQTELKKACIARLAGTDIYDADFDDIRTEIISDPVKDKLFPRPNIPSLPLTSIAGADQGAFVRFFEQAFEWENMMYLFYPYYWGRHQNWYSSALLDNPDPLFAEFLKSGAARVVVPVRLQLEGDVRYFLTTGQVWHGGGLPEITDSDYLPITEEIKARDNALGQEKPQGEPWEVVLPTTLIKLRDDDSLPIWKRFVVDGSDIWVPGRMQQNKWVPDYGKLDAQGNWTPS